MKGKVVWGIMLTLLVTNMLTVAFNLPSIVADTGTAELSGDAHVTVALISDQSELLAITPILDSIGISYDIYNDNRLYLYTEDLNLLLSYQTVIFNNYYRKITSSEHSALQSCLSSGGNLLVTGYGSLGKPFDVLLANIVRSSFISDNRGEPDLYVVDMTHPIMNGPYGSFPAGYHISGLYGDCDAAEANSERNAITVAELGDGYDKIIATELSPGRVVYWNGKGTDDWTTNADCEAMFKNTINWLVHRHEHDLAVSLKAPPSLSLGRSTILRATVYNTGLSNETDVELQLLINGSRVANRIVPKLINGSYHTLKYMWTPTVEGTYNVTAYSPPVPDEAVITENVAMRIVSVQITIGTYISVDPPKSTVMVGNTFTVNVTVSNVSDLFAWGILLTYDNTVLNCREDMVWLPEDHVFSYVSAENYTEAGPFVEYDGLQDSWVVIYGFSLMGTDIPLFSGSGTLCQINFTGIAVGMFSLTLPLTDPRTDLKTPTQVPWPKMKSIEFDVSDGNVLVVPPLLSDLDQDGVVSIADISVAAVAFGSFPEHPRWNPIADLNKDGWVDISDIAKIACDFGKTV